MAISFTPTSTAPNDILDAIVSCLVEYAEEHGKPTLISGAKTYAAQLQRLTLDMAALAFADDDMGDFVRLYRAADILDRRGHSYTYEDAETLEQLADALRVKAGDIADHFDATALRLFNEAA